MKNVLPFFILALFAFACTDGQKKSEDGAEDTAEVVRSTLQNMHMNGNIKSITETPYTPGEDGSIGDMDSCCLEVKQYNRAGFLTTESETNNAGEEESVYSVVYSDDNKYVSGTVVEDGAEVWKRMVERDDEGEFIHALDYDTTGQVYRRHTVEERNEYDQPVSGKTYDGDSTYLGTWGWQIIDGARAGRSWVDSAGVQLLSRIGEVNDNGWVSKVMVVSIDAETGDTTKAVETYSYDAMDDAGNWTQRTKSEDGKAVKVSKRTYEYYEE